MKKFKILAKSKDGHKLELRTSCDSKECATENFKNYILSNNLTAYDYEIMELFETK